ncbi:uncharacterized protein LOC121248027 [Juglans microcarpa x Juglans regia]|uniref:uncharacterized protein LOC121248027 n=1 Tax=Juglans microcarpa x Juglans regia TaxID=2249226 RepID=UPI001B7E9789|nr:uncharacterized protein LOC121248027 [Juglans microcarpa x Juglans regia]
MIESPVLSRRRRPSSNRTSKKVRLVCSFNDSFQTRSPPSGKLRHPGVENRIISVDRSIGFSKLRSRISDIFPTSRSLSFSIKYQLPQSTSTDAPILVSVASDEDVHCMMEEYDKLELYGKHTRLWLFVSTDDNDNVNGFDEVGGNFLVSCTESDCAYGKNGVCRVKSVSGFEAPSCESENHISGGGQFDGKVAKNVVKYEDDSLRKKVLKQQLLTKHSDYIDGTACGISSWENQKCDPPLIDLAPEPQVSTRCNSRNRGFEDRYRVDMLDNKIGSIKLPESENHGNPLEFPDSHLHPLYQCVETSSSMPFFSGQYRLLGCNGVGVNAAISSQTVATAGKFSRQSNGPCMGSTCNGGNASQELGNIEQAPRSILNRENIMPREANCHLCNDHWLRSAYPPRSSCIGESFSGGLHPGIRNHRFGVYDTRNQQISSYHVRNHRHNPVEMGNHRTVTLDGRIPVGKFYHGLRPNSNISKQGQSLRVYYPNFLKPWSSFSDQAMEGRANTMDPVFNEEAPSLNVQYGNEKLREQDGTEISQYRDCNPEESHLAYHGPCARIESPLSPVMTVDGREILSTCSNCMEPYQAPFENFHGVSASWQPVDCDLEKKPLLIDEQQLINISSLTNNTGYSNETEFGWNNKRQGVEAGISSLSSYRNGADNFQGGVASSMDVCFYNLSLSSSKEIEHSALLSHATSNVIDDLLIPRSKHVDLMGEGQLSTHPQVDESNGFAPNSSSQNEDKMAKDHVNEDDFHRYPSSGSSVDDNADNNESLKCSKVIGGIPSELAVFYTHLARRELQTIRNTDLEYIKELGSGTYGTVFYGKWKGSDVAIKRIKPSCFTEVSLEKDRLVADFWKEAHVLGELHHPNILAFYGVVTDGPMTNLATVTEYMVSGSLKQVLRRKDRTIDRRKRLIIAMDAAFGMEYLHGKNIVHFDLKSHNFLVNMRDPLRPVCKIGDLGLSKVKRRTLVSGGVRGTIPWMAPELLNSDGRMVTEKVDVYSFGIVMWEILTGEKPYANLLSEEIIAGKIKGNLRPEIPSWCDPTWRSLMERCWSSDPDSRPAFSEIAKELRTMSAAMNIN